MEHIITFAVALFAGMGVSAGTFAFIIVIGIIPRILRKCKITNVILIENVIIIGVITGNVLSIYGRGIFKLPAVISHAVIIIYGVSTGMFVGCMSVALAEILHTFPVLFRRTRLNKGLKMTVYSMAIGKLAGSLFYFIMGYFHTA